MGGGIVTRMLAVGKVDASCAVIDGGMTPYQLWKPLTYLIGVRDFAMVELGKHMSVKALQSMFDPEKYTDDDLKYIKKAMHSMSARTIWRSFYSCNNYSMPKPVPPVRCRIAYWYGSDEKPSRKWDIAYVRKNVSPCAGRRERRDGSRGILHPTSKGVLRKVDRMDSFVGMMRISQNGPEGPFSSICVHSCAPTFARVTFGVATVYTSASKQLREAVFSNLCTLLSPLATARTTGRDHRSHDIDSPLAP